jgi:hypothetical protein
VNMAYIFKDWRPRIDRRMNPDRSMQRWFHDATYAKTSNGYWLAWREGDNLDRVAFLTPNHPDGQECRWLKSWDKDDTIETAINYIESGEFEADEKDHSDGFVLNLFIKNPETGEWE